MIKKYITFADSPANPLLNVGCTSNVTISVCSSKSLMAFN